MIRKGQTLITMVRTEIMAVRLLIIIYNKHVLIFTH